MYVLTVTRNYIDPCILCRRMNSVEYVIRGHYPSLVDCYNSYCSKLYKKKVWNCNI